MCKSKKNQNTTLQKIKMLTPVSQNSAQISSFPTFRHSTARHALVWLSTKIMLIKSIQKRYIATKTIRSRKSYLYLKTLKRLYDWERSRSLNYTCRWVVCKRLLIVGNQYVSKRKVRAVCLSFQIQIAVIFIKVAIFHYIRRRCCQNDERINFQFIF